MLVAGTVLGVAPAPGRIELEEGELGESAIGHLSLGLTLAVAAACFAATSHAQDSLAPCDRRAARFRRRGLRFRADAGLLAGPAQRRAEHRLRRTRPTSTSPRATGSSPRSTPSDPPDSAQVDRPGPRLGRARRARRRRPGRHRARACSRRRSRTTGSRSAVDPRLITPAIIGANRAGVVDRSGPFDCETGACAPGVTVIPAAIRQLPGARRAAPRRRPADRLRAPAAGRARGAGDRDRRARASTAT